MNKNNYCVIMAGGIGSRFWPISRVNRPKQFIDVLGTGKTLIQQTFDRLREVVPAENFLIVTNTIYKDITKEQLPGISEDQILTEPDRRNTAPCIAYANYRILKSNPDARIIVAPSDHLILNEPEFIKIVEEGLDYCETTGELLTLGIKPSRPETGYGYIQSDHDNYTDSENEAIKKVKTFTEKPDHKLAKTFYESGDFFWNSGIFLWTLKSINHQFEYFLPEVFTLFESKKEIFGTKDEHMAIEEIYASCPNISIDYGIMEKTKDVSVYISDFGWSDLGTWGSLYEERDKDSEGNSIISEGAYFNNTTNCLIDLPGDKIAVINNVDDLIIVEADGLLLVSSKRGEQDIKKLVEKLKSDYGDKVM